METKTEWIFITENQMEEFDKALKEEVANKFEPKHIETPEDLYHNEIDNLYNERLYGSLSHDDFIRLTKEADEKFEESKKNNKDQLGQ